MEDLIIGYMSSLNEIVLPMAGPILSCMTRSKILPEYIWDSGGDKKNCSVKVCKWLDAVVVLMELNAWRPLQRKKIITSLPKKVGSFENKA